MLKMTIKVSGDKAVLRKLDILRRAGVDNKEAMKDIGEQAIEYYSSDAFATRGRVFGSSWPDYNPAYKRWKQSKWQGKPMLVLSGNMQEGFFAKTTGHSVTIDNHAPYYKYHQSSAARSIMPRRQMAGINGPIKRIVRDAITKDINRKLRSAS